MARDLIYFIAMVKTSDVLLMIENFEVLLELHNLRWPWEMICRGELN